MEIPQLDIPSGQRIGIVGNNGAGKTSFLSMLLDLVEPSTGAIFNKDVNVNQRETWKEFTSSYLDDNFLVDYLTPEEYFQFTGDLRGISSTDLWKMLERCGHFFNGEILGKRKYLRDFSKGNRKKIGVAAALLGSPQVIVLDEPFANLDPGSQVVLKGILLSVSKQYEASLIVSSHDLHHLTDICDRIILINKGKIEMDRVVTPETLEELTSFFAAEDIQGQPNIK